MALEVTEELADFCEGGPRYMYRCHTPDVPGLWQPQVHKACAHNMVAGLLARTMGPTPDPTDCGIAAFRRAAATLRRVLKGRAVSPETWDFERVVASYKVKRLRVRYEAAKVSLERDGLCTRRDSRVKAFVKGEKVKAEKLHKPRVIMGRDPRYCLELASYLKPLEHVVYPAMRGWGNKFLTHTRLVGKGLDARKRAALIRRKFNSEPGLVAFEVDCKSFESHLRVEHLEEEHKVYASLNPSPRLSKLLGWQKKFDGKGTGGVKFHLEGVRASGDFNTGLGNTLVMCCLVLASAAALGHRFDFLADGDNAIMFVRERDLPSWRQRLPELFLSMGHELEVENTAYELEEVSFGQSKPLLVGGTWTMVRDPRKVLSQAMCGYKHFADMRGGVDVLRSIGYCEAVLGRGVPVLQEFAQSILRVTSGAKLSRGAELDNFEYAGLLDDPDWSRTNTLEITSETRIAFEKSWGISVEEQITWEKCLSAGFELPTGWSDVHPLSVEECLGPYPDLA